MPLAGVESNTSCLLDECPRLLDHRDFPICHWFITHPSDLSLATAVTHHIIYIASSVHPFCTDVLQLHICQMVYHHLNNRFLRMFLLWKLIIILLNIPSTMTEKGFNSHQRHKFWETYYLDDGRPSSRCTEQMCSCNTSAQKGWTPVWWQIKRVLSLLASNKGLAGGIIFRLPIYDSKKEAFPMHPMSMMALMEAWSNVVTSSSSQQM